jgi:hypothetical protein
MSNTRQFYSDPLAAAWMQKHFGMRFTVKIKGIPEHEYEVGPAFWADEIASPSPAYYVHPDSLHLLELQVGDVIGGMDSICIVRGIDEDRARFVGEAYVSETAREGKAMGWCKRSGLTGSTHIIQRNGVAFHWPERESA